VWQEGEERGKTGKAGESRQVCLALKKKNYTPQGKTLYLFSVEAMAFGGKRYRVFLFLKSAAEGKGQFDRDIFPTLFGG
jgi:hypothetical protein